MFKPLRPSILSAFFAKFQKVGYRILHFANEKTFLIKVLIMAEKLQLNSPIQQRISKGT